MNQLDAFIFKYGTSGLSLLVARFIEDAPSFCGEGKLAAEIGAAMGELEGALNEYVDARKGSK